MPASAPSRRREIVDAAVRLASLEGLEGLTIGRLAAELHMSKSGLHGHFGSKEALQLAAFERAAEIFAAEVIVPAGASPSGLPRLSALMGRWLSLIERDVFPGGCFLAGAAAEFDSRPGPVRDAVAEALDSWRIALAREAEHAGARDPEQLAFELTALAMGANHARQLHGDERAVARARRAVATRLPGG